MLVEPLHQNPKPEATSLSTQAQVLQGIEHSHPEIAQALDFDGSLLGSGLQGQCVPGRVRGT